MKTIVILNGDILDYSIKKYIDKDDYIIACDGGLRHCKKLKVMPNLILGDFDSVDSKVLDSYGEQGIIIKKYPVDKDYTDGELGIIEAIKSEHDVIILGAMSVSGRVDHMFSNVFMLNSFVGTDILASIVTEKSQTFLLSGVDNENNKNKDIKDNQSNKDNKKVIGDEDITSLDTFRQKNNLTVKATRKFCSLIPVSNDVTVSHSSGLKYGLQNQTFTFGSSRSISNECVEDVISITIKSGRALIVFSED